jgi:hypothetical protein
MGGLVRGFRMQHALIPHVGLVSFVRNVAREIQPRDTIGTADEVWMRDRAE